MTSTITWSIATISSKGVASSHFLLSIKYDFTITSCRPTCDLSISTQFFLNLSTCRAIIELKWLSNDEWPECARPSISLLVRLWRSHDSFINSVNSYSWGRWRHGGRLSSLSPGDRGDLLSRASIIYSKLILGLPGILATQFCLTYRLMSNKRRKFRVSSYDVFMYVIRSIYSTKPQQ